MAEKVNPFEKKNHSEKSGVGTWELNKEKNSSSFISVSSHTHTDTHTYTQLFHSPPPALISE